MTRPFVAVLVAALMAAAVFAAQPLAAAESRFVEVGGEGSIAAIPDTADITAGVTTRAPTAAQSLEQNNARMAEVLKALEDGGIANRDVSTSRFSVGPYYPPRTTSGPREPAGYQVSNRVTVRVRDLTKLGGLLDTVVNSGANEVQGVRFYVADPALSLAEARRRAVADARSRAELLATAAGATLGPVIHILEQGIQAPRPMMMAAEAASRSVPIAPGEQEVTARVGVRFELR